MCHYLGALIHIAGSMRFRPSHRYLALRPGVDHPIITETHVKNLVALHSGVSTSDLALCGDHAFFKLECLVKLYPCNDSAHLDQTICKPELYIIS